MRRSSRRGSIYIATLTTSLVVASLATAALATVRIQRRQSSDMTDSRQAALHAQTGMEMALYRVQNDANWRTSLSGGVWNTDQAVGSGFYSFTGTDPTDNNLTDSAYDPVILTATGKSNGAVHKIQTQLNFTQPGLSCLKSAVHAGHDLEFNRVTVACNGTVSANHDNKSKENSVVFADAVANHDLKEESGGVFTGTKTEGTPMLQMPDINNVMSYYEANGTQLTLASLPLWDRSLISNTGFEAGTPGWLASNCSINATASRSHSGTKSLEVTSRAILAAASGPYQNVTSQVQSGVNYTASVWIYVPGLVNLDTYRLVLRAETVEGPSFELASAYTSFPVNRWTELSVTGPLNWTGTLSIAKLRVESNLLFDSFFVDDFVLKEADATSSTYTLHRKLISPSSNPTGGATNAQGIYILDCNNSKVNIQNCRIVGTLVIKNPGNGSMFKGRFAWEPAQLGPDPNLPNLPALLVAGNMQLDLSTTPLSEQQCNVNFNPVGTSYLGISDTDKADSYPSSITGIIYSTEDLTLVSNPWITGSVIANENILVTGTSPASDQPHVYQSPLYYEVNAPPGFQSTSRFTVANTGYRQVVD